MTYKNRLVYITLVLLFSACTSEKPWTKRGVSQIRKENNGIYSLFLIGDAGEPSIDEEDATLKAFEESLNQTKQSSDVVFLGDNVYYNGLPDTGNYDREDAEKKLNAQLSTVKDYDGRTIFIPGNHDWHRGKYDGIEYVRRQEEFIKEYEAKHDILFLPENSCGGPVEYQISDSIVLIIMDTQWWLHPYRKNRDEDECDEITNDFGFIEALDDLFDRNRDKQIIVIGHHPLESNGSHGGHFSVEEHLFPLRVIDKNLWIPIPGIGSIYAYYRKLFGNIQDIPHNRYQSLKYALLTVFSKHPQVIYVCGHEHSLQYHEIGNVKHIISGSGSKKTYAKKRGKALFTHTSEGFVRLDFYPSGSITANYISVDEEGHKDTTFVYEVKEPNTAKRVPPVIKPVIYKDSMVTVVPGNFKTGRMRRFLLGDQYRDVWSVPTTVPILDLYNEAGGLTPVKKGGGQQTKSLRFKGEDGREYTARSVEKFPAKALPEDFRYTFAADLVKDQMSSANPYGALIVAPLAEASGVYHANPKMAVIPNDPKLGVYQEEFANTLVLFEEHVSDEHADQPFFGSSDDIDNTLKVLSNIREDHDVRVDQQQVVKSRIFDVLIGDWDRHEDQWKWAQYKPGKGSLYKPIPRDRDQAFYKIRGVFPSIANRKWAIRKLQNYNNKTRDVVGMGFNSRHFDRSFLTEMEWRDWQKAIEEIQEGITDSVIDAAFAVQPEEVVKNSQDLKGILKYRLEHLEEIVEPLYKSLSSSVDVVASDQKEYFEVQRYNDSTTVKAWSISKKKEKRKRKIYDRTFFEGDTKTVNIYGLDGKDQFVIKGNSKKGIRIRIIGGEGDDIVTDSSHVNGLRRKTIYFDDEEYRVNGGKELNVSIKDDTISNYYNRKAFDFDKVAPLVAFGYNIDDGIFIGGGVLWDEKGFRRFPYAYKQRLVGKVATGTAAFNFAYDGSFKRVFRKWDLFADLDAAFPNYQFGFYGLGNESVRIDSIAGRFDRYYKTRMEQFTSLIALQKIKGSHIWTFGVYAGLTNVERNNRFFSSEESPLVDRDFELKKYVGLHARYDIEQVNDVLYPTRGIRFHAESRWLKNADEQLGNFARLKTDLRLYFPLIPESSVTMGYRIGGATNIGEYEFFQANFLGGTENLRGHNRNRFGGTSSFYQNIELRWKLADVKTYLFPGKVGVSSFWDVGRVWLEDEDSNALHHGVGVGAWAYLFSTFVLNVNYAYSVDNDLIMVNTKVFF